MIVRMMPASSVASSPGFTCRWMSDRFAHSVLRGSITISFRPALRASLIRFHGFWWGIPPHIEITGFAPISIHVSASSNGCAPASHLPCIDCATGFASWSMVAPL